MSDFARLDSAALDAHITGNYGEDQETAAMATDQQRIPTQQDVESLKIAWVNDPCWDIEETDGYEAYYEILRAYRFEKELEWERARQERLASKAEALGVAGNVKLAEYVMGLEQQIERMQDRLTELERHVDWSEPRKW